ncbi:hypothetical protein pEaSNUABM56_00078 [Erwinia phage pEa_SNUABM_56]|uniref:Uncharacterized protein n=1 Tax=Erwinia phage pEp_SNUABM_01 TaxID=2601643 RepID=A0A5J6DAQ3_9CAUD|nr:histidyl tRNA synthetase [Erwinia phage pEp_SNUABM_01]QEQ94877.1 hypothetical protein pEpSNUABM01_051 [Erwinia phage pEp_SNUABM_01]UYL85123.1 hypothetical protein pEaSNUABM56_00078 [Erwinia phage pEa_SNUABM_56]
MNIDLSLIQKAIRHYEEEGVLLAKVPYLVDPDIMAFTCPPNVIDKRLTHSNGKQYVASAEQSFLQLEKDGRLDELPPLMMALTPCYRDESTLDDVHLNIFLKLEIFHYNPQELRGINWAYFWAECMQSFFADEGVWTHIVGTDAGYDVLTKSDLELGSFGYRTSPKGVQYVYATGLAEPRASIAIEEENG